MESKTNPDAVSLVEVLRANMADPLTPAERIRIAVEALERIRKMKATPIGDTGFQTGPRALFNAAQSTARQALALLKEHHQMTPAPMTREEARAELERVALLFADPSYERSGQYCRTAEAIRVLLEREE